MFFRPLFFCLCLALSVISVGATRIIVLSDVHVTPGNMCEKMLNQSVDEINQSDAEVVLMIGDLTNEGLDVELKNVKSILDRIELPLFVLPGNHEDTWSQSATKTFVDLWGNDRFVTEVDSLVLIGINCGPYMKMGDGHIKQEDLHWLKSMLDQRVTPGKKVISINHFPLADDLDNYVNYVKILEKFPIIIHVNGHLHKYERYECGDIDGMTVRSLDLGKGNEYGYTVMDVSADSVLFYNKCIGRDPVKIESFAIKSSLTPIDEKDNIECIVPDGFDVRQVYCDSASIFTRLAIDDNAVYFGNSLGLAKSVGKVDGTQQWSLPTGASLFSRPVVASDLVVIPTTTDKILFVDKASGSVKDEAESAGPYVADGLYVDGVVYQGGYKKMEKWGVEQDKISLIWRYDSIGNYCQAAPAVDGNDVIFGAWDTYLYCLDARTGELRWKWNNGRDQNMLGPGDCVPVVTKDKVIVVAPDRYMTAIDRKTGKQLWRNNDYKYRESLGSNPEKTVAYAKTMDGELVAVDCTTDDFHLLWTIDMELGYDHAPCLVVEQDYVVYAGSRRGIVAMVDPIKKELIGQLQLGQSEVNGIDIDSVTGDVYVSLIEGTIYCISKKK